MASLTEAARLSTVWLGAFCPFLTLSGHVGCWACRCCCRHPCTSMCLNTCSLQGVRLGADLLVTPGLGAAGPDPRLS